jgi:hypothetical protein
MRFIKDFPRKFECAANQVVKRGYAISYTINVGYDVDHLATYGVVKISPKTHKVSIEIMMLEGHTVPHRNLHTVPHRNLDVPECLSKMFGDGGKLTPHMAPVNNGMNLMRLEAKAEYNEEQRFCFMLGRLYAKCYYADVWSTAERAAIQIDTDLLRKFGYNI